MLSTDPRDHDPRITFEVDDEGYWLATAQDGSKIPDYDASGTTPIEAVCKLARRLYDRLLIVDI